MLPAAVALLSLASQSADPAHVIAVEAPQRIEDAGSLGTWNAAEYDAFVQAHAKRSDLVPARRRPSSATARYGINVVIAQRNVSFVVDAGKIAVDANANGDLNDDERYPIVDNAVAVTLPGWWLPARFTFDGDRVSLSQTASRRGVVQLGKRRTAFAVIANGDAIERIVVDIDGSGLSFDRRGLGSFGVGETVVVDGLGYAWTFRKERLSLTPTGPAAQRSKIAIGLPSPALINGVNGVVLVDFWSRTCAPCVRQLKELRTALPQLRARGVELIGVTRDDPAPASSELATPWRQIHEGVDGALHRAFRVDAVPFQVLIDAKGIIRCAGQDCLAAALQP